MEPSNNHSSFTNPTQPVTPPAFGTNTPPQKKKPWLPIAIGAALLIIVIIVALLMGGKKDKSGTSDQKSNQGGTQLTVGSQPYLYGCSVATEGDFKAAFGLSGPDAISSVSSDAALAVANTTSETDLVKIMKSSKSSDFTSDCRLTILPNVGANSFVTVSTKVMQYTEERYAKSYLESQRRFALPSGTTDTSSLPKLASFPTNSFVKLPSAQGAASTISALVQQANIVLNVEYMMRGGETVDASLPKIDALMKAMSQKASQTSVATKSDLSNGHVTAINKPFIDTCRSVGLSTVAKRLDNIQFRVDDIASTNQYGALAGSSAAGDGVASSCRLTYNTSAERQKAGEAKQSTSSLDTKKRYPHTLQLITGRYASAAEAKAAFEADKARQVKLGTVQAFDGVAEAGYKAHSEDEIPDFSLDGDGKYKLIQDTFTFVKGTNLVKIALQQNHKSKNAPLTVTDAHAKDVYKLLDTMLAK